MKTKLYTAHILKTEGTCFRSPAGLTKEEMREVLEIFFDQCAPLRCCRAAPLVSAVRCAATHTCCASFRLEMPRYYNAAVRHVPRPVCNSAGTLTRRYPQICKLACVNASNQWSVREQPPYGEHRTLSANRQKNVTLVTGVAVRGL